MMLPAPARDLAAEIGRQAVAAEFALQFAGQRQVGAVGEILHPHRQQDVGGRHLVGANIDRPHAVLLAARPRPRSDHGCAPSSPRLSATPPPLGRRRLRLIFSKVHLLPRCWSSTTRLPFFRPISLRFCPSSPVRLRLSSQSRPASNPFCVGVGRRCDAWRGRRRRRAGMSAPCPHRAWRRRRSPAAWRCRRRKP